jgi:hypothetical protein
MAYVPYVYIVMTRVIKDDRIECGKDACFEHLM